jgi:carboxylesterase
MLAERITSRGSGGHVGILLIHRPGGTPAETRTVADGLARAGYVVHAPHLVAAIGDDTTRWEDWYASAEDALHDLRQRCDTVIVGGFSNGAVLSLLLAARHPDTVHATALFGPELGLRGWFPWRAPRFSQTFDPEAANRRLAHQLSREIGRIGQPALIVQPRGQDDAGFTDAWHLQRNLAGMVEMAVLDGVLGAAAVERTVCFLKRMPAHAKRRAKATAAAHRPAGLVPAAAHIGAQVSAA